jgi:hypothetical protein
MNDDKLEKIDFTVFSSSLHLFKNIKGSLMRCISFSKSKALFDLQVAFKNVVRYYIKTLLKRKLPVKAWDAAANSETKRPGAGLASFELSIEQELRCIYIVNTCEYCLETLPKLHSQISDTITEEYENQLDLEETTSDLCRELINFTFRVLINSILYRTEGIY